MRRVRIVQDTLLKTTKHWPYDHKILLNVRGKNQQLKRSSWEGGGGGGVCVGGGGGRLV